MNVYKKITVIVTIVFTLICLAAIGLACYFWVWLRLPYNRGEKIFIIIAFGFLGLLTMVCDIAEITAALAVYDNDKLEGWQKASTVFGLALCGFVPSVMIWIGIGLNSSAGYYYTGSSYSGGSRGTSSTYDDDDTPTPVRKKKAPVYVKEEDPEIVKTTKKRKPVYRNDVSEEEEEVEEKPKGKRKLVYEKADSDEEDKQTKTKKRKLVYKK